MGGVQETRTSRFGLLPRLQGSRYYVRREVLIMDQNRLFAGLESQTTPAHLRARLVAEAGAQGLLGVSYRLYDSPVGSLLLAATDRGLVRVAFGVQGHAVALAELAVRVSPRILEAPQALDVVAYQLDEYFAGRRERFELTLDHTLSSGFRGRIQSMLPHIAYGATVSYGELAAWADNPGAARAVGTACALNPLPIVVPCHRVLPASGGLGNYAGGTDAKRTLLELEGRVRLDEAQIS
jgi:methylated-DNA-[protein]-cysteine S-methyltransferase